MKATIVVFANDRERSHMSAEVGHDFINQPKIFGKEEAKLLRLCSELCSASLGFTKKDECELLLKKIYGIAKTHHVRITWYGEKGHAVCEPDRFLVSGKGIERLAFIQC